MSKFETTTCSRCGGSGRYSFNQMDGDRCYGCRGTGLQFTARGKAARAFYEASQLKPLSELKPGMFLWDDTFGMKAKWLPIESIEQTGSYCESNGVRQYYTNIVTKRCRLGVLPGSKVRALASDEERQALLAAALAYQDTLGKNGKPLKRAA